MKPIRIGRLKRIRKLIESNPKNDEFQTYLNIYKGSSKISQNDVPIESEQIRDVNFEELSQRVCILRDLVAGRLHETGVPRHTILLGLASNFKLIKGGIPWLISVMKSTDEKHQIEGTIEGKFEDKHWALVQSIKRGYLHYKPMRLENFSPYADDARYANLIEAAGKSTNVIKLREDYVVMPLAEAESKLIEAFNKALNTPGFHVIKAPTGIGKSRLLENLPMDRTYAIALPTHALKEEIMGRINSGDFVTSPELPKLPEDLKLRMDYLMSTGAISQAYTQLYQYRNKIKKDGGDTTELDQFYADLRLAEKARCLVTTHAKALMTEYTWKGISKRVSDPDQVWYDTRSSIDQLKAVHQPGTILDFSREIEALEQIQLGSFKVKSRMDHKDVLIFDEDPLTTILDVGYVTREDLAKLQLIVSDRELQLIINDLLGLFCKAAQLLPRPSWRISENMIKQIARAIADQPSGYFEGNLLGLFSRNCRYLSKSEAGQANDGKLFFIQVRPFPKAKTIIVLDATADYAMYSALLGAENFTFTDLTDVETVGKLTQHYGISASLASLKNPNTIAKIESLLADFKPEFTITYKTHKGTFQNTHDDIYFFNCSGKDELRGKRIAVVGTPQASPVVYALYAAALGFDIDPADFVSCQTRWVKRNGFEFKLTTFDCEPLRMIQLYCIERELLQAVGRARILRENTEVLLISNFPLRSTENVTVVTTDVELNAIVADSVTA